jgi:hypothetical protein
LKIKLEEILPGDEIEEQELNQKRKNNVFPSAILSLLFLCTTTLVIYFPFICKPRFYCLISKGAAGSMEGKKRMHHPLTRKEITDDHRIRIKYSGFLFLLTRDYTLELM